MHTPMRDVEEFHKTFAPEQHEDIIYYKIDRRMNLIEEESQEVLQALIHMDRTDAGFTSSTLNESRQDLAKELADLLYVVYGTAEEFNIPLEEVFAEVHKSNMSKAESDGTVKRNQFGKVLKPSTYTPPDLSFIDEYQFL